MLLVVTNLLRAALSWVWTVLLGAPLLLVLWVRYGYALLRKAFGAAHVADRILEANARLAGWVAQKPWTGVLLPLLGLRVRVIERVRTDWRKAHVICANHASLLDILALVHVVPPPFRFVAKRELLRWPIIGWALRPAGQIIVDRHHHHRAVQSLARAAMQRIHGQVIFFVEGTRSRTGELLPFKKGAFHFALQNGLPVLPAAIRGSREALARAPWWRLRPGRVIEVIFCEPIPVPVGSQADGRVDLLLRQTREVIAAAISG